MEFNYLLRVSSVNVCHVTPIDVTYSWIIHDKHKAEHKTCNIIIYNIHIYVYIVYAVNASTGRVCTHFHSFNYVFPASNNFYRITSLLLRYCWCLQHLVFYEIFVSFIHWNINLIDYYFQAEVFTYYWSVERHSCILSYRALKHCYY